MLEFVIKNAKELKLNGIVNNYIKNAKELKLNGIVNNYMLLGIRRRT